MLFFTKLFWPTLILLVKGIWLADDLESSERGQMSIAEVYNREHGWKILSTIMKEIATQRQCHHIWKLKFGKCSRKLCLWDFPGKNTGVSCHALLRESSPSREWTCICCISCNAGDLGSISGSRRSSEIPWRRKWLPTPVLLPREFCGQRSLTSYSPWGHKESDMTECD